MAMRLVVEWTRTTVRLAVAEGSGGRVRLKGVYSQPLSTAAEVTEALRTLLKTQKSNAAQVIGVVPREQVLTRVVKFPATNPVELLQMVELYAKAQLPYPRDQMVIDFHLLSQQGGFSTVAVVACQREAIDRQLTVLHDAGLSVTLLTVSSWGVLGWYRQVRHSGSVAEPVLVANVDETRTDLVLISGGRILSSRSVSQGAQDWDVSGDAAELLMIEVERSRAAIRKELQGHEVQSVLLTGVGALRQWSDLVAQRVGLPVTVTDWHQPFKGWNTPTTSIGSPVVITGLAGSDVHGLLNLSPSEVRVQVSHREQVRTLVMTTLLLVGVLILGTMLLGLQASRQQQLAQQLEQVVARVEPTAKVVQEKTRSAQLVLSTLNDRRRLARMLSEVFHQTPSSVTLEGLTFERGRWELVLRGSVASTQEALSYMKQLEQVEGVGGVDLKYSTRRVTPLGDRIDFELVLRAQGSAS